MAREVIQPEADSLVLVSKVFVPVFDPPLVRLASVIHLSHSHNPELTVQRSPLSSMQSYCNGTKTHVAQVFFSQNNMAA